MPNGTVPIKPAGSYGVDALLVPVLFTVGAVALLALTIVNAIGSGGVLGWLLPGIGFLVLGACAVLYWNATLRGKFVAWSRLLDGLGLRGDERTLDLGCGRGAVLIQSALRVPHGHATGIDLWRNQDQTGNSTAATERNAQLNGVADRITLDTGDMSRLPYPDASFDLVTASVSIHNVPTPEGRRAAVHEALRVLRPGGRLMIADFSKIKDYEQALTEAGVAAEKRSAGVQMLWGVFTPTTVLEARKVV